MKSLFILLLLPLLINAQTYRSTFERTEEMKWNGKNDSISMKKHEIGLFVGGIYTNGSKNLSSPLIFLKPEKSSTGKILFKSRITQSVGFLFLTPAYKKLRLSFGVVYQQLNYSTSFTYNVSYDLKLFSLPILCQYEWSNNKSTIFIAVGPSINFLTKFRGGYLNNPGLSDDFKIDFEHDIVSIDAALKIGYAYNLNNRNKLFIETVFQYPIHAIQIKGCNELKCGFPKSNIYLYPHLLQVGYLFKL